MKTIFEVIIFILFADFCLFGVLSFLFGTVGFIGPFHSQVEKCLALPEAP